MSTSSLPIKGCWTYRPKIYGDSRGKFFEWFQGSTFSSITGFDFDLAQANYSISQRGVIRGIHFAKNPPGQAKYVTCFSGSVFDVLVDLRKTSPTFGKWLGVSIDSKDPIALYIPSGIGHGFMALEDSTTFVYLCDQKYNPNNEYTINPFDKALNIAWPTVSEPILSPKDKQGSRFQDLMEYFPTK